MRRNIIAGVLLALTVLGIIVGMIYKPVQKIEDKEPTPTPKPIVVEADEANSDIVPPEVVTEEPAKGVSELEEDLSSETNTTATGNDENIDAAVKYYSKEDALDLAKLMYAECRGVDNATERACVVWTVLNRADMYGIDIHDVLRAANQYAFDENLPVDEGLLNLAKDVLERWSNGGERLLPIEYIYFSGDGERNYFRNDEGEIWDYSTESPYKY